MTTEFSGLCPHCGRPATFTASTDGVRSTITEVIHDRELS